MKRRRRSKDTNRIELVKAPFLGSTVSYCNVSEVRKDIQLRVTFHMQASRLLEVGLLFPRKLMLPDSSRVEVKHVGAL